MRRMKPIISILQGLLLTMAFSSSAAVTVDLQTGRQSGTNAAMPDVTVTDTGNGYTVTYTITQAEFSSSSAGESGDTWSIPGFSSVENEGLPVLPYKGDSFVLPVGSSPSVTVLESEYVEFDGNIRLGNAPLFDGISQPATVTTPAGSFKSDGFYPVAIVRCEPLQVYRDRPIATVAITPIQYDSENAKIRVYTKISYKLSYEASTRTAAQAQTLHTVSEDDPFLNSYVINGSTDSGMKRAGGTVVIPDIMNSMLPEGYLIITTPKFQSAVAEFVKWKKRLGFNVTVKSQSSWTVNSVANAVKAQWNKDQNLCYLLIVGDYEDVPGTQFFSPPTSMITEVGYTDFNYVCFDGETDLIPDLYYGRISVGTNDEAEIVFNKIINYEKNPPINDVFYRTAAHCSTFSISPSNTIKENDLRYALTTEEILSKAESKGLNVKRHYHSEDNCHPEQWYEDRVKISESNNGKVFALYTNCVIPDSLRFPNYSWSHSATDIKNSISNGSLYVLYRGHSSPYGWDMPSFKISDIEDLSNGELLPVVFSITCSSGRYDFKGGDCFAEAFLKNPNGGCVGIFASSLSSYTYYNNYLAIGMFKSIWNEYFDSQLEFEMIHNTTHDTRLGVMLNQGFAQLRHAKGSDDLVYYTQQCYNCFGDPSMRMYSSVPTSISTSVNTSLVDGNTYKYSFNIPTGCKASVYNVTQDSVVVFDYLKGSVTFPKNDEISICFTGDNMRCRQWSNVQTIRPLASRSAEANIMVREDRSWEHTISDGSKWNEWFEGTTIINGKTYHNLHLRETKADDTKQEFVVAYMREEQGKVYMIAAKLLPEQRKVFMSAAFENFEDELLVYDFNLSEGGKMLMTEDPSVLAKDIWPALMNKCQNEQYITKQYVVEYKGNVFDAYEVTLIDTYNGNKTQHQVIKGVGGNESAMCFPVLHNEFDCYEGSANSVRLYDSEGNLLFDSAKAKDLSAADVEAGGGVSVEGGCVRVDQAGADCRVDIYDTCGSLVRSNLGEACAETSLEGLARGVYIVRVSGSACGCTTLKVSL